MIFLSITKCTEKKRKSKPQNEKERGSITRE
jgi:hypothetical protein